jgi:hypothetical protein
MDTWTLKQVQGDGASQARFAPLPVTLAGIRIRFMLHRLRLRRSAMGGSK